MKFFNLLSILGIFLITCLGCVDEEQRKREQAEIQRREAEAEKIRLARAAKRDSSEHYLKRGLEVFDAKQYKESISYFDSALLVLSTNHEAQLKKSLALFKLRSYQEAMSNLDSLMKKTTLHTSDIHLIKGQCLLKLNKKEEAITHIYHSSGLGNEEASLLYEQVNPYINVIVGYTTRCCDGSSSSAKGRGACSHHGGVCNWNDPIYRKKRKYELKK